MKRLIIKNFWLRVLALFLAVLVWFYVMGELNKDKTHDSSLFERMLPYRATTKEVPIKVTLIGEPASGYKVIENDISVIPSRCLLVAPTNILDEVDHISTEEIYLNEFTRSISKDIKIKPISSGITLEKDFLIRVTIPIKKIEQEVSKN